MVIVFTGEGKGKTTAAFGLALRAAGWEKKILIVQFLKKGEYGEIRAFKNFKKITLRQFGRKNFVNPENPKQKDYQEAKKGLLFLKNKLLKGKFDLIIADEINVAVKFGLIKKEEVKELIKIAQEKQVDLVLTGRWAYPELFGLADLVSEVKEIKHPFKKGILAEKGLDF